MESVNSSEYDNFSKIVNSIPINKKAKVFRSMIIDNEEFLRLMKILSTGGRYRFIDGLSTRQVDVLTQFFKQLLNRNMFRDENVVKFVRKFYNKIMKFGQKKTVIYKKTYVMLALYESLKTNPIEYMLTRSTAKTYVIGNGENTKSIDNPFGNCVPKKFNNDPFRNGYIYRCS